MASRWIAIVFGSALLFTVLAVTGIAALFTIAGSGNDIRYDFVSPSGRVDLYLIETCEREGCTHQAVIERPGLEGEPIQVRCGLDIEAIDPVFVSVDIQWISDESGVLIAFADTGGAGRSIPIDFDQDCNA
jgi:hypothetical protein